MRMLIIEDEPEIRQLVRIYLAPYGQCDEAENGEIGLRLFHASLEKQLPYQVIFLDIMMPGMNGNEVLETIRKIENEKGIQEVDGIKIIMLTAMDDTRNVITSFKNRCDSYVVKPFDEEMLIAELISLRLIKASPAN